MTADLHQAREALRAAERALQAPEPDHDVASAWASVADTWVAVHHAATPVPGGMYGDTSGGVIGDVPQPRFIGFRTPEDDVWEDGARR